MRTISRLAGALITLLFASSALAQFNAPIRYNEGPGLKLSDSLVFHPGLDVEGRYDSNVFYADQAKGAPYLRLIGHLHLAGVDAQCIESVWTTYGEAGGFNRSLTLRFAGMEIMRRLIGVAQLPLPADLRRKAELLQLSERLVLG